MKTNQAHFKEGKALFTRGSCRDLPEPFLQSLTQFAVMNGFSESGTNSLGMAPWGYAHKDPYVR